MRAVLYVRVSKGDDQDPETQLRGLRAWARSRGWRVVAEKGDSISGDPKRRKTMPPELTAALQLLRAKRADVLAVWSLERVVRSMRELMNFLYEVERVGGTFASMKQPQIEQLSGPIRDFMVAAHGLFAELEVQMIRERTIAGLARVRAEGRALGRPKIDVDSALAAHLYAELGNLRAVAAHLGCSPGYLTGLFKKRGFKKSIGFPRDPPANSSV